MRDYLEQTDKRKTFILNYKIKKGMIVIKWADGTKEKIPHNKGNEDLILNKMKKQVKDIDENKFTGIKRRNIIFDYIVSTAFIVGITVPLIILCGISMPVIIISLGAATLGVIFLVNGIQQHKTVIDLKKNKKFIEIETELNSNVKKHDNMLINTSKITKRMVKRRHKDENIFTINTIHSVPIRDFDAIMDNAHRYETLKYDYTAVKVENKPKIKKRTKDKK